MPSPPYLPPQGGGDILEASLSRLIECVPNFSEGRDKAKIKAITDAIEAVAGVQLLDVDPGAATNRTVVTFAGPPEIMVEAAFRGIKKAYEVIDMSAHRGEHARQGACDVCPFVPISGVTIEECIELANRLGRRVGEELNLPVYLYALAAKRPERVRLPDIRAGEYEALKEKLKTPEFKPDYGPARFDPKFGVLTTGVRKFLIAYNVNLNTRNVKIAKEIGLAIREKGRVKKDSSGKKMPGPNGESLRDPGLLKHTQATGWFIDEYQRAQVTINILDHIETPIHTVFDTVKEQAEKLGARVTGSELVGLIPKDAMVEAGRHYMKMQGSSSAVSERELIRIAVLSMGLEDLTPFDIDKKIIEYNFINRKGLNFMKVNEFVEELASDSPAPGGGSVAALAGSLSAALTAMVTNLTFGKKGHETKNDLMEKTGIKAQALKDELLTAVETDTEAFNKVMAMMKLPKKTDEEKAAREKAVEAANKEATLIPLSVLEKTIPSLKLAAVVAKDGNQNSLSDSGVAALMARASAHGAYYNVLINLRGINDKAWAKDIRAKADKFLAEADKLADEIGSSVVKKLT